MISPAAHLDLLRTFRRFELESVLGSLAEEGRGMACEIGGGDGFQAALLKKAGYEVRSFDVDPSPEHMQLHPVLPCDGVNLPLADESVDLVFSSNVLEHVADLDALLAEQWRILKPGGLAAHVVPNPLWRLLTSITHYPWLVKRALLHSPAFSHAGAGTRKRTIADTLRRILAAPPHGTGRSALAELYTFSPVCWKRRLAHSGLVLERRFGAGLFYSGNALIARMPFSWRRWLGSHGGSVSTVYLLRKPAKDRRETDEGPRR